MAVFFFFYRDKHRPYGAPGEVTVKQLSVIKQMCIKTKLPLYERKLFSCIVHVHHVSLLLYYYYYKERDSIPILYGTQYIGYQEIDGAKFFAFELIVKECTLTQSYLYSCVELIATSQGLKSQKQGKTKKPNDLKFACLHKLRLHIFWLRDHVINGSMRKFARSPRHPT